MKVLVDTCIWSLAFRRKEPANFLLDELIELIKEVRIQMIGPIRQELLSGIKSKNQFESLKKHIATFPDFQLETVDYEKAAEFFNLCKGKGIQGSNTDFLICALSSRYKTPIFTIDKDFELFDKHLPIEIYKTRKFLK